MGVKGLLPQLKSIQESLTLERFRGKTLAIDSYAWLHRGSIACSWELAQDLETTKYVAFFKKRISMMRHFGVEPYFVFDGDKFTSKSGTELEREQNRIKNKEKGLEFLRKGDSKRAYDYFFKSVDVTPSMAKTVIEYLKSQNLKYIVAPYEADPQMVYLEQLGLVDGIISEDSDLLIFGANCLLTKLNEFGECVAIRREEFSKCKEIPIGLMNDSQLRMVACLGGCDYTTGIPGIGIMKAFRLVKKYTSIERCILGLKLEGKTKIPEEFELEYKRADLSFQFQRVFNPITRTISTLNEMPVLESSDQALVHECIGALYDNELHKEIAYGEVDPITKTKLMTREETIRTKSFSAIETPSKTKDVAERVAKRSYSTPVNLGVQRIDTFFKVSTPNAAAPVRSSTLATSDRITETRVLTPKTLSPTSKRRKLFNTPIPSTLQTPSSSKFFPIKRIGVEYPLTQAIATVTNSPKLSSPMTVERLSPPIAMKQILSDHLEELPTSKTVPEKKQNASVTNSSDFDLTDPDDDDDDEHDVKTYPDSARGHNDTFGKIRNQRLDRSPEDDGNDKTVYNKGWQSPNGENQPEKKGLLKKDVKDEITKGLYEKFGFNGNFQKKKVDHVSEPLRPIQYNKPVTTTLKTKRGVTKNLTLDSFIYRG